MYKSQAATTPGFGANFLDGGFDAARVLQRFSGTQAPKVAIMGDSTSLATGNNTVGVMDDLWGYLITRLREDNPAKTFAFGNYGIGGSTMFQYNRTGTQIISDGLTLPSWFSTVGNTWISYLQTFAPDVILFNWGINDSYTFTTATLVGLLTAVAAWTKVPDIIFVTNKSGNPAAGGNYALATYQAGYLNAAALMRTVAQSNAQGIAVSNLPKIGVLDIGRAFQMSVNGFDPCVQSLNVDTTLTGQTLSTFPYVLPATAGDLYLDMTWVGQGSAIQAAGGVITVTLGDPAGGSANGSSVQFSSPTASNFFANYFGGTSVSVVSRNLNNWSTTDNRMQILASGSRLYILTNTAEATDVQVVRYAGPFTPRISLTNAWASPSVLINTYAAGTARQIRPILSALEAWGPLTGSGNGINHNTSLGLNVMDKFMLQRTRFTGAQGWQGQSRTVTAAGAVTLTNDDSTVLINKTVGAATTVNLPAQPTVGKVFVIKDAKGDANVNNITITPASGNIDGAATLVLNTAYGRAAIEHNGTQWYQVG